MRDLATRFEKYAGKGEEFILFRLLFVFGLRIDLYPSCRRTYVCLLTFQVERVLNESVAALAEKEMISPTLARMLLHANDWDVNKVSSLLLSDEEGTLRASGILPTGSATIPRPSAGLSYCAVCAEEGILEMRALVCGHSFCSTCWRLHIEPSMSKRVCPVRIFATSSCVYERFVFRDYVSSHPELKFCVGNDCQTVIRSKEKTPKRVTCSSCNTSFCVACGVDYHAPTSCETIKHWLLKCADDSETANYISAHTKDCPQCHSCIEKNGGCNHMQCAKCKHHFCWMCFGDWKTHGSEYYECSRYKVSETGFSSFASTSYSCLSRDYPVTTRLTGRLEPSIHAIVDVLKQSFVAANIRVTGK
ncbi:unnamed protein product [Heligmosomoides polygyrus]|uniref:RBR-type E3 ubiquitin transferase n=1 Tax=Heligmosomoides polygyrus TaxID=6339 RepID=A0A3P8ENP2_HELPZ|nr:unnamed protein product [Heligmosomoides polygyrus]